VLACTDGTGGKIFLRVLLHLVMHDYPPLVSGALKYVPVHNIYLFDKDRYCRLGTIDFDAQMSGIKFWTSDENLRPVYKKPVLQNIEWLLAFWTSYFMESTTVHIDSYIR
jgi:hypothetical protein